MTRRGGTSVRASRKPVVVLAGEDANDRRCLRILLQAFCPEMRGRIIEINDPVRLRRATDRNLAERVEQLARKARARAARERAELACVFVHEDLDGVDGSRYSEDLGRVQQALERELGAAHYVLAVEEIEAWLLLFPEALAAFVSSWRLPAKYRGRDTGRLPNPKRILMREVGRTRRYRESDAAGVLEKAVALGCHTAPAGTNRSWGRLREDVLSCCRGHLGTGRG